MRALALALLFAAPVLAGCLGASDAPLDPASRAADAEPFVEQVAGDGRCALCVRSPDGYTESDRIPAVLPVTRPGPENATVVATWSGEPRQLEFSVTLADQRLMLQGTSPHTFSLPVEHLRRPTKVTIDLFPAEDGVARDLTVAYVLTLAYPAGQTPPAAPAVNLTLEAEGTVGLAVTVPSPFGNSLVVPPGASTPATFEVPRPFPTKATLTATWAPSTELAKTLEFWFFAPGARGQVVGKGESPLRMELPTAGLTADPFTVEGWATGPGVMKDHRIAYTLELEYA